MKQNSLKAYHGRQHTIFTFFALSSLLFVSYLNLLATNTAAQSGWRVELEEGKSARSTLSINNRCLAPHLFRIKSKIKYLHFEEATDSILIGANSTRQIKVRFDATGLRSKVYRSKVVVECLDCKKEQNCKQDHDEVAVEMSVVKPTKGQESTQISSSSTNRQMPDRTTNVKPVYTYWEVLYGNRPGIDPSSGAIPLPLCPCTGDTCNYICYFGPALQHTSLTRNVLTAVSTIRGNVMVVDFNLADLRSTRSLNIRTDAELDTASARELGYRKITILKGSYEVNERGRTELTIRAER